MSFLVNVTHTWTGSKLFEFETREDAEKFQAAVKSGDLGAIVEQGDIETAGVDLTDFDAGEVREVG